MLDVLLRTLSLFWPIRRKRLEGAHGTLDLVWENGRLVVNSANANQSWGSLQTVWERVFAAEGIADRRIEGALVLGLGAGGVVKLLRAIHPKCHITAVDNDPVMIRMAREHFDVRAGEDLRIVEQDAFRFIQQSPGTFDLVVVDLFEDDRVPAALFEDRTLHALRQLPAEDGLLLINTMVDRSQADALAHGVTTTGLTVKWCLPLPSNRVLVARAAAHPS